MKDLRYILLFFLFGSFNLVFSQEGDKPKFSISLGIGYYDFLNNSLDYSSVSFIDEPNNETKIKVTGDAAIGIDTYIFSFYFSFSLVEPIAYKQASYSEFNLTVGKEFLTIRRLTLEGHLGIGYFKFKEAYAPNGPIETSGTIGFPLHIKVNYYLTKKFAVGLNPNVNFNFESSIMSINLISKFCF